MQGKAEGDPSQATASDARTTSEIRILAVDDDPNERFFLERAFRSAPGLRATVQPSGAAALAAVQRGETYDIVLCDLHMPEMDGLELVKALKAVQPSLPIIMLSHADQSSAALVAIRAGAYQFLSKGLPNAELLLTVRRAVEHHRLSSAVESFHRLHKNALFALCGESVAIQRIIRQVDQVARSGFSVLVQGETGTGKELVSRAIHDQSDRSDHPFIAIDCGALPENLLESELFGYERGAFTSADHRKEGRFVLAGAGTLFLDEIGNLPRLLQPKLLRVLQERVIQPLGATTDRTVGARFIAATNDALDAAIAAGTFREDLFYRLTEFTIVLPPLRDRLEDVPPLASRFREEASVQLRKIVTEIEPAAMDLLYSHRWPGNVRELRNVIRRAVLVADGFSIGPQHLPSLMGPSRGKALAVKGPSTVAPAGTSLKEIAERAVTAAESRAIRETLEATNGNKSQAAKQLGVDFKTLRSKIKRYGLTDVDGSAKA